MDIILAKIECDRCKQRFEGGARTLSKMNMDVICVKCKENERQHEDYAIACDAELAEVRSGNYGYKGMFNGKEYPFGKEPNIQRIKEQA